MMLEKRDGRRCPSLAQPLETESERTTKTGRQRKDPSGTTTTMTRPAAACSRLPPTSPCSTVKFPLEKNAFLSRLLRKSVQASKPAAAPVVAVAVPLWEFDNSTIPVRGVLSISVSVDRSIAVSRERCLCDGHFFANVRPMGAASRQSRKNHRGGSRCHTKTVGRTSHTRS